MEDELIKDDTLFFTMDNNKVSFSDENDEDIYMMKKTNDSSSSSTFIQRKRENLPSEERSKTRKEKNREAARRSRTKRKQEIEYLILENKQLKKENKELKLKLSLMKCPKCNENMIPIISPSSSTTSLDNSSSYNRPIFLFTALAVIACITLNSLSINTFFELPRKSLRNLNEKGFEITGEDIVKANYSIAGMYITYGDYYSITHQSMFLDTSKYYFENKGPINILKESEAQNFANETCVNCVVELNKDTLVKKPDSLNFKLIILNQRLVDENASQFYNYNNSEFNFEIFQIDCKSVGLSPITLKSYLE